MKSLANASDCKELRHRLQYARVDSSRRWGKMSAAQMICHLADSFRAVMGEKPWQLDRPTFGWQVVKHLALYAPVRWPRGVPTRPEVDQFLGGTPPLRFEDDVHDLQQLLDRFARQPRDFQLQPHPMFGLMSEREWLRWGYLHTDHHLRQFGL